MLESNYSDNFGRVTNAKPETGYSQKPQGYSPGSDKGKPTRASQMISAQTKTTTQQMGFSPKNAQEILDYFSNQMKQVWAWPMPTANSQTFLGGFKPGQIYFMQSEGEGREGLWEFLLQSAELWVCRDLGELRVLSKRRTLGEIMHSGLRRVYQNDPSMPDHVGQYTNPETLLYNAGKIFPNPPFLIPSGHQQHLLSLIQMMENSRRSSKNTQKNKPLMILIDGLEDFCNEDDIDLEFAKIQELLISNNAFLVSTHTKDISKHFIGKYGSAFAEWDFVLGREKMVSNNEGEQGLFGEPISAILNWRPKFRTNPAALKLKWNPNMWRWEDI